VWRVEWAADGIGAVAGAGWEIDGTSRGSCRG